MSIMFDQALKVFHYTLKFTGIDIEKHKTTRKQMIFNRIVFFLNFSSLNFDAFFGLVWIYEAINYGCTLTELTYNLPCSSMAIVATIKAICMLIYENEISYLVRTLRTLDKQYPRLSEEKKQIVQTEKKFLDRVVKYFHLQHVITMIAFPMMTGFITLRTYTQTNEVKLLLPFLVSYPFEVNLKNYPVLYVKQIFSQVSAIFTTIGVDFLFIVCCTCIRTQFKLLSHDFEGVIPQCGTQDLYKENYEFNRRFPRLIYTHQKLIKLMGILENVYSKVTFINFATSSILICTTLFTATTIDDSAFVLSFVGFLLVMVVEIYFLCLFGNMVTESSVEIGDAIYNSRWYVTETKIAKNLLMVLKRSQKPCKITAYGFAKVDLNSFTRILSRSWSYFALLKSMHSRKT